MALPKQVDCHKYDNIGSIIERAFIYKEQEPQVPRGYCQSCACRVCRPP